jgi:glutaminase
VISGPEAKLREASIERGSPSAVTEYLERLYARHGEMHDGEVATYIPELSQVDPSLFGICG